MKHQFPLFLILIQTFAISMAFAQTQASDSGNTDPCLDDRGNAYMDRQSSAFLHEVQEILHANPPRHPEPRERRLGLLLLDAVLHDKHAAHRQPVQEFYQSRMNDALRSLQSAQVEQGAMIWKLYNMGFIVRTKSVTLAFDINSGEAAEAKGFGLNPDVIQQFVQECDVLFISHRHRDHAEKAVARLFLGQSKPVIAPSQVWEGEPIHDSIRHFTRVAHEKQRLVLGMGKPDLAVVIYPGHQMRSHENNVPLVFTPEGISIAHMGDQINEGDFMIDYAWIDQVRDHHDVDILFPPCWTNEIYRIAQGFDPKLVIPGHENELGHPVDDRVPYWGDSQYLELTYPELKASSYPVIPMVWGERYYFDP
jgi:L-ascorbate metabolism protein UlaG (beta-lactamase superfamily)